MRPLRSPTPRFLQPCVIESHPRRALPGMARAWGCLALLLLLGGSPGLAQPLARTAAHSTTQQHDIGARTPSAGASRQQAAGPGSAAPSGTWLSDCCGHKKLRELYLPGSHDSGTYRWTTPTNLPPAVQTVAALLFNVVGDLSRTQRLTIYEQLLAGIRVLDLRIAVNPWLQPSQQQPDKAPSAGRQLKAMRQDAAASRRQLTGSKLAASLVLSHSLPGPALTDALADVRRFLRKHPTEVVVVLVQADAASVNVAGVHRMHAVRGAWAAAATIFEQQLAGVQLLSQQQVEQQTIAELGVHAPGGSVLLHSNDLHAHGLAGALNSSQLHVLESYFNGTKTDSMDVGELESKLHRWLSFWHKAGWRRGNVPASDSPGQPFLLLASAEVTLGVTAICRMLWNKLWPFYKHRPAANGTSLPGSAAPSLAPAHSRTLFELGLQSNQQLLADLLLNNKVPKAFNIWLLDAVTPAAVSPIIRLNTPQQPPQQQKLQQQQLLLLRLEQEQPSMLRPRVVYY